MWMVSEEDVDVSALLLCDDWGGEILDWSSLTSAERREEKVGLKEPRKQGDRGN